jgi:5-methylcytosine-specific restriction endonuclease McrA
MGERVAETAWRDFPCDSMPPAVFEEIASQRARQGPPKSGLGIFPSKEARMSIEPTLHPEIDALERLGDEIALLSAHISVATARLLDLIRDFDARGGWAQAGAKSCAEWLSWRVGMDLGAAREHVRVARALTDLPRVAEAFMRGELSYSKVRALTRVATPETEERLLAASTCMTAAHVERLVRAWRRVDRAAENKQVTERHRNRSLHVYQDADGMYVIQGRLTPEAGALLRHALDAACDRLYGKGPLNTAEGEPPTTAQRHADALAMIADAALHHDLDPGASGDRYQVVVHVDAAVLADPDQAGQSALEEGDHVSAETSRRLACDASRVVMRHDGDGRITEIGARTRTIPVALRRALQHRDRGCRFPGCGLRFTQGHHIQHWAQGGPTTLSNLTLLCQRHHRSVHEDGFHVVGLPNGDLEFRRPDGRLLAEAPRLPDVPTNAAEVLCEKNVNAGARPDTHTLTPDWDGTRFNVGYAIDVMHPRAIGNDRAA